MSRTVMRAEKAVIAAAIRWAALLVGDSPEEATSRVDTLERRVHALLRARRDARFTKRRSPT